MYIGHLCCFVPREGEGDLLGQLVPVQVTQAFNLIILILIQTTINDNDTCVHIYVYIYICMCDAGLQLLHRGGAERRAALSGTHPP